MHACLRWALSAAVLGIAINAWAQTPASPSLDPTSTLVVELIKGGGLPAVLAVIAWAAGRASTNGIVITVRLHPDDRQLLAQGRDSE